MLTAEFWRGTLERALKTFAQTLVAIIGVDAVEVIALDWPQILGTAATATLLSVLTSIGSASLGGPPGSPSLVEDQSDEFVERAARKRKKELAQDLAVDGVLLDAEQESVRTANPAVPPSTGGEHEDDADFLEESDAVELPEVPEGYEGVDPGIEGDPGPDFGGDDDDWFGDDEGSLVDGGETPRG